MLHLARVLSSFPHTQTHTRPPFQAVPHATKKITIPTQSMDNFYGFFVNYVLRLKHQRHIFWCYVQNIIIFLYKGVVTMWYIKTIHGFSGNVGNVINICDKHNQCIFKTSSNKVSISISWAQVNWKFLSYPQLHSAQERKIIFYC